MDYRIALPYGKELKFYNHDGGLICFSILSEIGRGASCIVYNASYTDNSGSRKRVKLRECYPLKPRISREETGELIPDKDNISKFEKCKEEAKESFKICGELFYNEELTNSLLNTFDIYEANNTVYTVSAYSEGRTLAQIKEYSAAEAVCIVKNTALVIQKIHNKGFLYLDIKPENIFVYEGTNGLVQLFDFDSLIPIYRDDRLDYAISYTEGFAPIEQKSGQTKRIGRHSDVYSVGALLFFLMFGNTPRALDCGAGTIYDFTSSILGKNMPRYNDKLFRGLTDFFHNTLASYYLDRYNDMETVLEKLSEIEKFADITVPFIISTKINAPKLFVGRDDELNRLDAWFKGNGNCLFIFGMGGIGKSSLVRKYVADNYLRFETVLYLWYNGSIKEMINDNGQVFINTVRRDEKETDEDFFKRKMLRLRELVHNTKSVIVIDNYIFGDNDLNEILNSDWKAVFITRQQPPTDYDCHKISAIAQRESLILLFENHLQRKTSKNEKTHLNRIIDKISGHTLILELIAKQIKSSYFSLAEADRLIDKYGFSAFANEKIDYAGDRIIYRDTIAVITDSIFNAAGFSVQKKTVIKMLSLFGELGAEVNAFAEMLILETKNDINELIKDGWIENEGFKISLHPVIKEIAVKWRWTEDFILNADKIMGFILYRLRSDGANRDFLALAENILKGCENERTLYGGKNYQKLLCKTVINAPIDREEYIIENSPKCLAYREYLSDEEVLTLYDLLAAEYERQGNLKRAYLIVMKVKEFVVSYPSDYNWGMYYDILASYYDEKLNGYYSAEDTEQKEYLRSLLSAVDKGIEHMKKTDADKIVKMSAKLYVSKLNILIRGGICDINEIKKLFTRARDFFADDTVITEENVGYHIAKAWYFTYIEFDAKKAEICLQNGGKIARKAFINDIDYIDYWLIPRGNVFYELGKREKAEQSILNGIKLCGKYKYKDIAPYTRKKEELKGYLAYIRQGEQELE